MAALLGISPLLWLWAVAASVGLIVGLIAFSVASHRLEQERLRDRRGHGSACAGH